MPDGRSPGRCRAVTYNLDFNRDGRLIASSSEDGTVRVCDTATGAPRTPAGRSDRLHGGQVLPGFGHARDPERRGVPRPRLAGRPRDSAETRRPAPEGAAGCTRRGSTRAASASSTSTPRAASRCATCDSGREATLGGAPETGLRGAQFSPDGEHVAASPRRGDVVIWRLDRRSRPERAFKAHRGDVNTLAYGPDGRIITGGTDRTVRIWDPRGGRARGDPRPRGRDHDRGVHGRRHAGADARARTARLRLWDARSGAHWRCCSRIRARSTTLR